MQSLGPSESSKTEDVDIKTKLPVWVTMEQPIHIILKKISARCNKKPDTPTDVPRIFNDIV
jgi:hypothetical protein